jgi:microcystin-dependent protein
MAIPARAATVTTLPATAITNTTAILNGSANPAGQSASGFFQWGPTTNYGATTAFQPLGSGSSNTNFSQFIGPLATGTTYHFRATIQTAFFIQIFGADQSFFMPGPPSVTTTAATSVHPGQATLNATINPNSLPTIYWFQHGPTTSYGNLTPANALAAGTNLVAVSNLVTGLPRSAPYHFNIVASNVLGQSVGGDMSFTVPQGPTNKSGATGNGQPFDIRQPSLELNYIICTNGIYPSRNGPTESSILAEVRLFAGNFEPDGWQFCQGQVLYISNNTALFSLIGTSYGGDGVATFRLPDLRGCKVISSGQGAGLSPWVIGEVSGETQHTLRVQEMPSHTHTLPPPDALTGTNGGGQPRNNIQPTGVLTYLVQLEGIFPAPGTNVIFEQFLGQIRMFAGNFAQIGTATASGQTVSIAQNTALFTLLGTNFGGDGQTTFQLPDLQGRSPLGIGQGPITSWSLGQKTGVENVTMTAAQLPAHQHTVPSLGIVTGFTGNNQPQTLMQPSLALQFLICTNGEVPSNSVQALNQMIGEIQIYAGTNVPVGWLLCDGTVLPIAKAPTLFGIISNYFGGDGITTFALPNLSGRIPVGASNSQPSAAYGAEQTVLTTANLPSHTHAVPVLDFDRWITSFGLSNNLAGFAADADLDNEQNGYEWATGTNPTNAQSLAPPLTISSIGSNAIIGFPRNTNAVDVIFTLQRTTNLANPAAWTGIATNLSGAWNPPAIVTETGATNPVSVGVSDSLTNAPAATYRLQVTWP